MLRVSFRGFAWLLAALVFFSSLQSRADLPGALPDIGDLQRWSVFTLGSDTTRDELLGDTTVYGDVGVAGIGDISLKQNATIEGNLYCRSNGTVKATAGTQITGTQFNNQDSVLDNDVAAAIATSRAAGALRQNFFAPTGIDLNKNQGFTVTGGPGDTVVLKLNNFKLAGNSTFTLEGTATTTFIINVTKQFSLSGNAKVALAGGVQWNNVLFNICTKDSAVSLSGNSNFSGMLMANRRTVQLADRATVTGEVIANRVMLTKSGFNGNVSVGHPPVVSP
jgi:hypothetical protein